MSNEELPELDFSQRMGITPEIPPIQIKSMNSALRNSLWNVLSLEFFNYYSKPRGTNSSNVKGSNFQKYAEKLYADFYKIRVEVIPIYWHEFKKVLSNKYNTLDWDRVYAFVEFTAKNSGESYSNDIMRECNKVMARENSAYRFVAGKITPITSPEEIAEVERAIKGGNVYTGVTTHLRTALILLSDQSNPDPRNSIKESISAVESLAKQITGNSTTLGPALSELEKHHKLHPALKSAFSSLYGWTSNADGIRHSLMDVQNLTQTDARFMLITCSAFINFVIDSMRD